MENTLNNIKKEILHIMIDLFAKDNLPRNFALKMSQRIVTLICSILEEIQSVATSDKGTINVIVNDLKTKEFYSSEYLFIKHLKQLGIYFEHQTKRLGDRNVPAGGKDTRPEVKVFPLHSMYTALFNKTDLLARILQRINDDNREVAFDLTKGYGLFVSTHGVYNPNTMKMFSPSLKLF